MIWFWKKQQPALREETDYAKNIAEIRARIAALRSRLERDEESNKNITTERELPQDSRVYKDVTPRHNERAAELDDIKAKLMRKKL